jgi:hypothetical protein
MEKPRATKEQRRRGKQLSVSPAATVAAGGSRLFVLLATASLAAASVAAIDATISGAASAAGDELRWESVACVLDTAGLPLSWGVASATRGAPALVRGMTSPTLGTVAHAVARWSARAAADAYFVPLDACAPLWAMGAELKAERGSGGGLGASELAECARGLSLMVFVLRDRFEIGMCVDELAAAAVDAGGSLAAGSLRLWRLPLRALKVAAVLGAPSGTLGYFVALHMEAAWGWLLAQHAR